MNLAFANFKYFSILVNIVSLRFGLHHTYVRFKHVYIYKEMIPKLGISNLLEFFLWFLLAIFVKKKCLCMHIYEFTIYKIKCLSCEQCNRCASYEVVAVSGNSYLCFLTDD